MLAAFAWQVFASSDVAAQNSPPESSPSASDEESPPQEAPRAESTDSTPRSATASPLPELQLSIERLTLPNGLRVVLNEDHSSPSVAVCMTYDVGSRNEPEGRSGYAHLFEHLMFQGSRNVGKGEHFKLIAERGGRMNGTTNKERTNYFEVLPSSELELGLWLEADRLKSLALNQENFDNQRQVVQEEYRMRYDNRVFAQAALKLPELVFQGDFAYAHSTIGFMEDLDAAQFAWTRDFHRTYYVPNNAVLTVTGDFDSAVALSLIKKHFGEARPGAEQRPFEGNTSLSRQTSERFLVMVDEQAQSPALFLGWMIPTARTKERRALDLATLVLTGGQSGRLEQSLVLEKASASSVASWTSYDRGPGMFGLKIVVAPLSNVDTVMKWLEGELKRLRLIGPSQEELERARALLEQQRIASLQYNKDRAVALGEYEVYFGDANLLLTDLGEYRAISTEDVRKAAQAYLKDTRRSIIEVYPPGWVRDLGPVITTTTYVVQRGDTLIGIAKKHGTTADDIAKQNRIAKGRPIHPGQRLLVTLGSKSGGGPKVIVKTYEVKKGDTLIGIAKKFGISATDLAKENKLSTKKAIFPGQQLTITLEVGKTNQAKSQRGNSEKKAQPKPAPKKATPAPKKTTAPRKTPPSGADKAKPKK